MPPAESLHAFDPFELNRRQPPCDRRFTKMSVLLKGHPRHVVDDLFMRDHHNLLCHAVLLSFTHGQLYGKSSTAIQLALDPDISIVALDNAIAY